MKNAPASGGFITAFWRRYQRNNLATFGLALVTFDAILAASANLLAPGGPFLIVPKNALLPPSLSHIMGVNDLGIDVFSQVIYGLRTSFFIGIVAALTSLAIGSVIGAFSGYYGGKVDVLLMRLVELFQIIPNFVLALVIASLFGATIENITLTIGFLSWPATARLIRAEFLSLKERDFVVSAHALGASNLRVMFGEIFPNAAHVIIANSSLEVGKAILIAAGLGFLGVGDPNVAELGSILGAAQGFLYSAWWMAFFPGLVLATATLGMALIGDGLNEAYRTAGLV